MQQLIFFFCRDSRGRGKHSVRLSCPRCVCVHVLVHEQRYRASTSSNRARAKEVYHNSTWHKSAHARKTNRTLWVKLTWAWYRRPSVSGVHNLNNLLVGENDFEMIVPDDRCTIYCISNDCNVAMRKATVCVPPWEKVRWSQTHHAHSPLFIQKENSLGSHFAWKIYKKKKR